MVHLIATIFKAFTEVVSVITVSPHVMQKPVRVAEVEGFDRVQGLHIPRQCVLYSPVSADPNGGIVFTLSVFTVSYNHAE